MNQINNSKLFLISPDDNVAVALSGERAGHKFAIRPIAKGERVIKYGMPIGTATADVAQGEWVHSHNLKTALQEHADYVWNPVQTELQPFGGHDEFEGYARADGDVGIRNDLWIIPTVGCVNGLVKNLAEEYTRRYPGRTANDIRALPLIHPFGCSQLGDDHARTADLLAALCRHPNAGGVLVVALGCENNTLESFLERIGTPLPQNVRYFRAQDEEDDFAKGMTLLEELRQSALSAERTLFPVSKLRVGLKCGGSDGLSGITANPLCGRFSDRLTAQDGTAVLTEVPEMFGAETILLNRCISGNVFQKGANMINDFKDYFVKHGQTVYENPSPGNKAGGITTLEEKSLGCVQKGGLGPVMDVHRYGEQVRGPGLHLLEGPGNDMVASTVLAAAGCHMILFTTGRGTPFGTVVPTLKIATNTPLAGKKRNWIDFDAGALISGTPMEGLADALTTLVLDTASGRCSAKNELYSYQEIAIFKDGVTL